MLPPYAEPVSGTITRARCYLAMENRRKAHRGCECRSCRSETGLECYGKLTWHGHAAASIANRDELAAIFHFPEEQRAR